MCKCDLFHPGLRTLAGCRCLGALHLNSLSGWSSLTGQLCCVVLVCVVLCCAVLCCVVLVCVSLCYNVLYCTVFKLPCACVEFKKSGQVPPCGKKDNDQDVGRT